MERKKFIDLSNFTGFSVPFVFKCTASKPNKRTGSVSFSSYVAVEQMKLQKIDNVILSLFISKFGAKLKCGKSREELLKETHKIVNMTTTEFLMYLYRRDRNRITCFVYNADTKKTYLIKINDIDGKLMLSFNGLIESVFRQNTLVSLDKFHPKVDGEYLHICNIRNRRVMKISQHDKKIIEIPNYINSSEYRIEKDVCDFEPNLRLRLGEIKASIVSSIEWNLEKYFTINRKRCPITDIIDGIGKDFGRSPKRVSQLRLEHPISVSMDLMDSKEEEEEEFDGFEGFEGFEEFEEEEFDGFEETKRIEILRGKFSNVTVVHGDLKHKSDFENTYNIKLDYSFDYVDDKLKYTMRIGKETITEKKMHSINMRNFGDTVWIEMDLKNIKNINIILNNNNIGQTLFFGKIVGLIEFELKNREK
jgi:hypothetical protein